MNTRNREHKENVRTTKRGGDDGRASRPRESPPDAGLWSGTVENGGSGDVRLRERTAKMMVVARTSRMAARMAKKVEVKKAMAKEAKHAKKVEDKETMTMSNAKHDEQDFGMGIAAISAGRGPERAARAARMRGWSCWPQDQQLYRFEK